MLLYLAIGHCSTKTCQNLQKPEKFDFCRDINNACTDSAIAGNTAINSMAKMKPLTAQARNSIIEKCAKKEGGLLSGRP